MITMLQAAAAQQPQGAGWTFWLMIGAMILIMWLFMWRPESKRRKQMQEFIANLKKGDKIITLLIEVDSNVTLRIEKNMVVADPSAQTEEKK